MLPEDKCLQSLICLSVDCNDQLVLGS